MLPLAICSRATALLRRDNDKNGFSSLTQRTNGMTTVTTKDGVEIFYKDWGPKDAQPIVFHHGWPLTADDWDTQMLYFLSKSPTRNSS